MRGKLLQAEAGSLGWLGMFWHVGMLVGGEAKRLRWVKAITSTHRQACSPSVSKHGPVSIGRTGRPAHEPLNRYGRTPGGASHWGLLGLRRIMIKRHAACCAHHPRTKHSKSVDSMFETPRILEEDVKH
jgi:hypothetical protein